MKPGLVLDCSIAMTWCFRDEVTPATQQVLKRLETRAAIVPVHWRLEVANTLWSAERRKRVSAEASRQYIEFVQTLPIDTDPEASIRSFEHLLPISRATGLTIYDAAYLELAERARLPLATLDDALRRVATAAGVPLLGM